MRAVSVVVLTLLLAATLSAADPPADDAAAVNPLERIAEPIVPLPRAKFDGGRFAVRPGEVIVLTGSANAVFEQQEGWLETMLALSAARQQPNVRHMSWEGDTVYEQARALNFGGWAEQFAAVGASTIVAWFGGLEALDDSRDDDAFAAAYGKLLDEFGKTTPRLVVISPAPFEKPASPLGGRQHAAKCPGESPGRDRRKAGQGAGSGVCRYSFAAFGARCQRAAADRGWSALYSRRPANRR